MESLVESEIAALETELHSNDANTNLRDIVTKHAMFLSSYCNVSPKHTCELDDHGIRQILNYCLLVAKSKSIAIKTAVQAKRKQN